MDEPEYMFIPIRLFPANIIQQYDLNNKCKNGMVLAKIVKGMYGLPQAGWLAYDQLVRHLATADYIPAGLTPGLFKTQNTKNHLRASGGWFWN